MSENDRDLALKTLREICNDSDAPKQAKATAARTLLEMLGDIGKLQAEKPKENKALHEMTRAELDAELAAMSKRAGAGASKPARDKIRLSKRVQRKKPTKSNASPMKPRPKLGASGRGLDVDKYPF